MLKQIFKNVVFDRYKSISNKLNDIEKSIINNLIKKYKYNDKNEKPDYNNNNNNKRGISNNNKNQVNLPIVIIGGNKIKVRNL